MSFNIEISINTSILRNYKDDDHNIPTVGRDVVSPNRSTWPEGKFLSSKITFTYQGIH